MAWKVEFEARAEKQLSKLNKRDALRIVELLEDVTGLGDPRLRGHSLKGQLAGLWRYRVSDWRVVCQIEDHRLVVLVIKIGHRREAYD